MNRFFQPVTRLTVKSPTWYCRATGFGFQGASIDIERESFFEFLRFACVWGGPCLGMVRLGLGQIKNSINGQLVCTFSVLVLRMAHRKWIETEHQPGTAEAGNMLGCCLNYFRFLWAILSTSTVEVL